MLILFLQQENDISVNRQRWIRYVLAKNLGHSVTELKGALTGLLTKERWVMRQWGLLLRMYRLLYLKTIKPYIKSRCELLFTHFGISGPIVRQQADIFLIQTTKMPKPLLILNLLLMNRHCTKGLHWIWKRTHQKSMRIHWIASSKIPYTCNSKTFRN